MLHVLLFSSSALRSATDLRVATAAVAQRAETLRVVALTSAAHGVTRALATLPTSLDGGATEAVAELGRHHQRLADAVLSADAQATYRLRLAQRLTVLRGHLTQQATLGPTPARTHAILSEGPRLMAPLLALALSDLGLAPTLADGTTLLHAGLEHRRTEAPPSLINGPITVVAGFAEHGATGQPLSTASPSSDQAAVRLALSLRADRLVCWGDAPAPSDLTDVALRSEARLPGPEGRRLPSPVLEPLVEAGIPVCIHGAPARRSAEPALGLS
ncbi:MAG: hypothetical protein AAGI71_17760 [Bacteroidota bacterium]